MAARACTRRWIVRNKCSVRPNKVRTFHESVLCFLKQSSSDYFPIKNNAGKANERMKPITTEANDKKIDLISSVSFGRGLWFKPGDLRYVFSDFLLHSPISKFLFFNPVDWDEMGKKWWNFSVCVALWRAVGIDWRRHIVTTRTANRAQGRRQFQIKTLESRLKCENNERRKKCSAVSFHS